MAQRFLGGIFGNTAPSTASVPDTSGVFDMNGQYYIKQEGGWSNPITASGGNVDAAAPGNGYKYHIFTSPGSFTVSSGAGGIDVLAVGGGGAGAGRDPYGGGGGGAGLVHYRSGISIGVPAGAVTITIGDGGDKSSPSMANRKGGTTTWDPGNATGTPLSCEGGGGAGMGAGNGTWVGAPGGSGGSGIYNNGTGQAGGTGSGDTFPGTDMATSPPNGFGTDGTTPADGDGGGGGGAGGVGDTGPGPSGRGGNGGLGWAGSGFASTLFPTMPSDWKTAVGPEGRYGGGGGGGGHNTNHRGGGGGYGPSPDWNGRAPASPGSPGFHPNGGGGGFGGPNDPGNSGDPGDVGFAAIANTGGGGGGAGNKRDYDGAGHGGSGIVIVRYSAT